MAEQPDGWAEHARAQRRDWLALTFEQRLAWLEQAKRFCRQALGAARSAKGERTPDGARKRPADP